MCVQDFKVYTACGHPDPEGTPTKIRRCYEYRAKGHCVVGVRPAFIDRPLNRRDDGRLTDVFCPDCQVLRKEFEHCIGSLPNGDRDSPAWTLYHRIGWKRMSTEILKSINYAQDKLDDLIMKFNGREQEWLKSLVIGRIGFFEAFKEWLAEKLDKKNSAGELYFPRTEIKGKRMKNTRLRRITTWTLEHLANGDFDEFNIGPREFKGYLTHAFNELIYDWENHFHDEPNIMDASREFDLYWKKWTDIALAKKSALEESRAEEWLREGRDVDWEL
ncbi:hypothetical protein GGR50DRAFT_361245 [Xylaria sp. CBS 124048]|nr:hypothetical protein GGR50DRAFT_361245 [Xylaria sp. CBS 124048]